MLIIQTVDQQSKIVEWWTDQSNNRLQIGCMDGQIEHPCQDDYTMHI